MGCFSKDTKLEILDTPGILLPSIENKEEEGLRDILYAIQFRKFLFKCF